MISKLVAVFALTAYIVSAQSLILPVTQDFAVANNGYSGATVSRPDSLSFFNNGFQSSVSYFGIDLSPLAMYDSSTIASAVLTFTNYTLSQGTSATIGVTLLNYGQVFDENTVTLSTQPTSQGSLGSVTFVSGGSATIQVQTQLLAAQTSGGLFGFRVDPPGGPVTVASHRVNPTAVYVEVTFGATTTAPVQATPTSTSAQVPSVPTVAPTAGPTRSPATTTSTVAPAPGAPTVKTTTTTRAPSLATTTRAPSGGSTITTRSPSGSATTTTRSPPGSSTTTSAPTVGPTQAFESGSTSPPVETVGQASTDAPRSSAANTSAALLCIVPLALAILL